MWRRFAIGIMLIWSGWVGGVSADDCRSGRARVSLGYRQDEFNWTIAGPHHIPDVLSELKWDKLHLLEAAFFAWHRDCCVPYVRWSANYSAIMRGGVRDSDFAGAGRSCEFSRARSHCNRGNVLEGSGAFGVPFVLGWCGTFQLTPIVGFSWRQQHLHMVGGKQIIEFERKTHPKPIHGLKSEYRTRWWGPLVGLDAFWEYTARLAFSGSFEYHWGVSYRGRGDWNLREDFCGGFHHSANGTGWIARLGGEFAFDCFWLFTLDLAAQRWNTGHGSDKTRVHYIALDMRDKPVGFDSETVRTPFNGAHWHSFSAALGLAYRY